jgi:type III pantothenate kinase
MNLLTLDFGNTRAHAALFRHGKQIEIGELKDIESWLKKHQLNFGDLSGVISQVKSYSEELDPLLQYGLLCERIKDYWRGEKFAGMPVHYAHTLGEDRLIQAWWAFKNHKTPTLVIDAGSFLTIDVVTPEGFLGGHILPGFKAMGETLARGEQLQAPDWSGLGKELLSGEALPHSTPEALDSVGIAYAALIQRLLVRWGIAQVVISGGDAHKLQALLTPLTPNLPLHVRPDLVHWALLDWYQRNILG